MVNRGLATPDGYHAAVEEDQNGGCDQDAQKADDVGASKPGVPPPPFPAAVPVFPAIFHGVPWHSAEPHFLYNPPAQPVVGLACALAEKHLEVTGSVGEKRLGNTLWKDRLTPLDRLTYLVCMSAEASDDPPAPTTDCGL